MPISANQFKNMNELIQYLNDLEQRINILEEQNLALRTSMEELNGKNRELVEFLKDSWPKTSLFNSNFWVRAWTIFGHNLVIQLIIGVFILILYLVFLAPMIASMLQQVPGLLQ